MTSPHPSGDRHWTRREPERVLRGTNAPGAKLSEEEIAEIRAAYARGATQAQLARVYFVSRITIWRHIRDRNRNTR